jgi:Nitrogenase component 1 type Oxidoreductase
MSRAVSLSAVADAERRKKEVPIYCSSFESLFSIIVKAFSSATSAMQVVIGDDLQAFIGNAKKQGSVPRSYDVPAAYTPAFQGSHVNGYDNMLDAILGHFWEGRERSHGLRRCARCWTPRLSVRCARYGPATTCGTCARRVVSA